MTDLGKLKEITSTEKLLELIRSKEEASSPSPAPAEPETPTQKTRFPDLRIAIPDAVRGKNAATVGVDFGAEHLYLVKTTASSGANHLLLDHRKFPLTPEMYNQPEKLAAGLKEALEKFCPKNGARIWSTVSSAAVETRYLRIPKVPKRQLANAVFWSFKKESSMDEEDIVFDFEFMGEIMDKGIRKLEVMALAAPAKTIQRQKELFENAGFPLAGISIFPFGLQNLFRTGWLTTEGKNICSLYIGQTWSRIDVFNGKGNLLLSRKIKAGINSMVEGIREAIHPRNGAPHLSMAQDSEAGEITDETPSLASPADDELPGLEEARLMLQAIASGEEDFAAIEGIPLSKEEIFQVILPALERLTRQVERTLEHFAMEFSNERVSKIYLSGEISTYEQMANYIGEQLGMPVLAMDAFALAPAVKAKPATPQQRLPFTSSIGLALSSGTGTPNFLFTHQDKENAAKVRLFNRSVLVALAAILFILGGFHWHQRKIIDGQNIEIARLEQRLNESIPLVNQEMILGLAAKIKQGQQQLKTISRKQRGIAVLSEISRLTPEHIKLKEVSLELTRTAPGPKAEGANGKKDGNPKSVLALDGLVSGDPQSLETALAAYLFKLKASPLFDEPRLLKKGMEHGDHGAMLAFKAHLELK